jgi:apolipoprotein N-acyltransferase
MTARIKKAGTMLTMLLLAASLYFFAFWAPHLGWLSLIAFILLFSTWLDKKPLGSFISGFLFLFLFLSAALYWLYGFFHYFSAAEPAVSFMYGLLVVLVISFLPFSLTGLIWAKYRLKKNPFLTFMLLLPCCYLFACMLQHLSLNTIPWYFIGNALSSTPLAGWGPVVGIYGMSWLAVCSVGGLIYLWEKRQVWLKTACIVVPIWLAIWLGGWLLSQINWTHPTNKPVNVLLIQGHFSGRRNLNSLQLSIDTIKRNKIYQQLVDKHAHTNSVIIFPENTVPTLSYDASFDLPRHSKWLKSHEITLLYGSHSITPDHKLSNALVATDGLNEQFYYKSQLIAFGEYNPFAKIQGKKDNGMAPGVKNNTPFLVKDQAIAPMVCLEATLAISSFYKKDSATWLVAINNNVWYRDSWTNRHVLLFSQARALETGKPMAYVSNSGYTATIDYHGHIQKIIPPYQNNALAATIMPRQGMTPYLIIGYWPLFIVNFIILLALIVFYYRTKQKPKNG